MWGNCSAAQKLRVQKAIKFGVRIVTGLGRRDHVSPSLRELGWSSVDELLTERDIATMRHLTTSTSASELLRQRLFLRADVSVRRTRATEAGHFELPRVRTEFARRSFVYRATSAWNDFTLKAGR